MQRFGMVLSTLMLLLGRTAGAEAPGKDLLDLARAYLEAREATLQETARPADVEKVLSTCSAALVYEHPRVGIRMAGLDAVRSGMLQFLGTSRQARIEVLASLQGTGMVAVESRVSFEAKDGEAWRPVDRKQVWVFEFDGSEIKRIIEYW